MSFKQLYQHAESLRCNPILVETHLVPLVKETMTQDDVFFTPVDLDTEISLGHIKQYRESGGVYAEARWITDIRYDRGLNMCWQRFVCCKELMHVFDSQDEKSDTSEKFQGLLNELESPPPFAEATAMYLSENKAKWMALAVLCPLNVRAQFFDMWANKTLSDYDVALELRIPEAVVPAVMGDNFLRYVALLTK